MKILDLVSSKKKDIELTESEILTEQDYVRGKGSQKRYFYLKPFKEPSPSEPASFKRERPVTLTPFILPRPPKLGPKTTKPKTVTPTKDPVKNPVKNPVKDLVKDPVKNPVKDLVKDPVKNPVKDPVKDPVKNPVKDPVKDPVKNPVKNPVKDPVKDPVKNPVKDPVKDPLRKDKPEDDKKKNDKKKKEKPKPQKDKKTRIRLNFAEIERRMKEAIEKAKKKKKAEAERKKKALETKKKNEALKKKKAAEIKKKRNAEREVKAAEREEKQKRIKKQEEIRKKKADKRKVRDAEKAEKRKKADKKDAQKRKEADKKEAEKRKEADKKEAEKRKKVDKKKKPIKKLASKPKVAHTIKGGDTLRNIAKANKTSVKELMRLNPDIKSPNRIFVGNKINLPPKPGVITTPPTSVPLGPIQTEPLKKLELIKGKPKTKLPKIAVSKHFNLATAADNSNYKQLTKSGKKTFIKNAAKNILIRKGMSRTAKYAVASSVPIIGWALNLGFLATDALGAAQTATRMAGGHFSTQADANKHRNMALSRLSKTLSNSDMSDNEKIERIEHLLSQEVVGSNEDLRPETFMLRPTTGIRKNVTSHDIWNAEFDDTGHEISFSNDKMNPGAYTQGDIKKQENRLKSEYHMLTRDPDYKQNIKKNSTAIELRDQINILRNAREDAPVDRKTAIKNYAYMILMMQRAQNEPSTITNSALMQGIMIVENKLLKK